MIDLVMQIQQKHGDASGIFVDNNNPEIWQSIKKRLGEDYKETHVREKLEWCRKNNLNPEDYMRVVPVSFALKGAQMLQHVKAIVEDSDSLIAIHPKYDKLLTSLRTAVANEYKLDKEQTSYHDVFDAFRLCLNLYKKEE